MSSNNKKANVAAFSFPFGSHPTALLHIVQRLAKALPDVQFSYFNITNSNQKLISNVQGYQNINLYNVDDGVPQGHIFSGNPTEVIELFIKSTPLNFSKRLKEVNQETGIKPTCLLTDAFLWFSAEIAEEMRIPWLAFWTAGPAALSLHMYTDMIHNKLCKNGESTAGKIQYLEQTLDFLPGMSKVHVSDLPNEILHIDSQFAHLLHNMSKSVTRAASVILNSFYGINLVIEKDLKSKLQNILNIGPFPLPSPMASSDDQSGCLEWLDCKDASSVVYISFGTMLVPPQPEIVALSEALEEKQVPYLWSMRDNRKGHILEGFFEKTSSIGKVVQWAPQVQVLAHSSVGVFVTHCGWNSLFESIIGGVPMICRPFFGDQMINKRFVEDVWGIGVGVEGGVFMKSGMMNDLNVVFKEGKKMKENISELRECAFRAASDNGSSSEDFKSLVNIITSSH